MKVKKIFPERLYVVSNFAVARNPIFSDQKLCLRFLKKLEKYLAPVCHILHYNLDDNQFQLIIEIKGQEVINEFYRKKKNEPDLKNEEIPAATKIFSQQMANLQASTAIHFNRKYKRLGALFARRFSKILIETKEDCKIWIKRMDDMMKHTEQIETWETLGMYRNRIQWVDKMKWNKFRSAFYYYKKMLASHTELSCFKIYSEIDFQGHFKNLLNPNFIPELSPKSPP